LRPYNDYNTYLKNKYGCKIYRIGLDAGFTCPNRDGTKGTLGCIYCDDSGSRSPYAKAGSAINDQLDKRIKYLKEKKQAEKFIAYFQAFTNTYAPLDKLKSIYDTVLPFKEIVGISIGTRPDAVDKDKLALIASYKERYEVWIEYGLQSSIDSTLKLLNRGHTLNDFIETSKLTKEAGILQCAHIIIGLPGESRTDIIKTAEILNELNVDGVKIHPLHVLRKSALEKMYNNKEIKILDEAEYAELVCDFLENLSGGIIIQRLTGQGTSESHIAPSWATDKTRTLKMIDKIFEKRGSFQGSKKEKRTI